MAKRSMREISWKNLYVFSFILGIKSGMSRPLDFFRAFEYPTTINLLNPKRTACILDIGPGSSILPSFLASKGHSMYIIDINKDAIVRQKKYAKHLGKYAGDIFCILGDARKLCFRNCSFRRIVAISSLEHIRADGDIQAVKEISRILDYQGIAVITVPFSSREMEEVENKFGYNKIYDFNALTNRLLEPSELLSSIIYFQEIGNFNNVWYRLPLLLRILLFWIAPFVSSIVMRETKREENAVGAILVLCKAPNS